MFYKFIPAEIVISIAELDDTRSQSEIKLYTKFVLHWIDHPLSFANIAKICIIDELAGWIMADSKISLMIN